jgi:hypothetical protein
MRRSRERRVRVSVLAALLCGLVGAHSAVAQDVPIWIPPPPDPPPPMLFPPDPTPSPPRHLVLENQYFDGSVEGLRAYLESIKSTDARLYAQLSPDVTQLESRLATARGLLVGGLVVGLLAPMVGFFARQDCSGTASPAALSSCGEDNMDILMVAGTVGLMAMIGGAAAYWSMAPHDQDLLQVVNKHNRVSPTPLRLQIGYDPAQRHALAGATLSF